MGRTGRKSPLDDPERRVDLLSLIRQGVDLDLAAKQVGSSRRAVMRYGRDRDLEFGGALAKALGILGALDALQDADGQALELRPVRVWVPPEPEEQEPESPPVKPKPAPQPLIRTRKRSDPGPSAGEQGLDLEAKADPPAEPDAVKPAPDGASADAPARYSRKAAEQLAWLRWVNADGTTPPQVQVVAGRFITQLSIAEMRIDAARRHLLDVERVRVEAERARAMMTTETGPEVQGELPQGGGLGILEIPSNGTEAPAHAPIRLVTSSPPIDVEVIPNGTELP